MDVGEDRNGSLLNNRNQSERKLVEQQKPAKMKICIKDRRCGRRMTPSVFYAIILPL